MNKAFLLAIIALSTTALSAQDVEVEALREVCPFTTDDTLTVAPAIAPVQHIEKEEKPSTTDRYLEALDSLRQAYVDWKYQGGDTLSNPYLFMLLSAPNYNGSTLTEKESAPSGTLSRQVEERSQAIHRMMTRIYAAQPWLVKDKTGIIETMGLDSPTPEPVPISKAEELATLAPDTAQPSTEEKKEELPETFLGDMDAFHIKVRKPNFWKVFGGFNLQLQQTYISENWYKGGNNSYAANGQITLEANYNNKQKLQWDNKIEARLGFQTAEEYRMTTFRPTTDLLRLTSKLGLQAHKHWYYTLALQGWTQMLPAYDYYMEGNIQKKRLKSSFMTPSEAMLSLGMDYKLSKKRFKATVNIAPFALNHKYVERTSFATNFGIDEGKHHKFSFGSTLTATASWAICKQLTWEGRLYAFTDYKKHYTNINPEEGMFGYTVEFENTIALKINKYLSTRLFLFPRYDTTVPRKKKEQKYDADGNALPAEYHSYLQFKEFLSFGLDITF